MINHYTGSNLIWLFRQYALPSTLYHCLYSAILIILSSFSQFLQLFENKLHSCKSEESVVTAASHHAPATNNCFTSWSLLFIHLPSLCKLLLIVGTAYRFCSYIKHSFIANKLIVITNNCNALVVEASCTVRLILKCIYNF